MTTTGKGISFSILIHIAILIIFYFIHFNIEKVSKPEFIEIIALETIRTPQIQTSSRQAAAPKPQKVNEINSGAPKPQMAQAQQIPVPEVKVPDFEPVDISQLPQRASRNIRSDLVKASIDDTLMQTRLHTQTGNIGNLSGSVSGTTGNTQQTTGTAGVSISATGSLADIGLEGLTEYIRNQQGNYSGYKLDGDIINRTIISKVLPDFPENVQRNGAVTIQFTVLENGYVSNLVITRKSEPEFERVSLEALRKWVFNRADKSNTGIITFHFRLE